MLQGGKGSSGQGADTRIKFPALWVSQNLVGSINSLHRECSRLALRKGFYKNLRLIDSMSHEFQIADVRKIRMLPPKPSFGSVLGYLTGNPHFQVELIFAPEPPETLSLAQVKDIIFNSFRQEKYSWEAMIDFDDFRDKISAASSLNDIFAIFGGYHV